MTRLYVICGHGHGDPGSAGGGLNEADLVRDLASEMAKIPGVEVLDTSKNWFAQNLVNGDLKKKVGGDPVLELHMDWSGSASARGGHVIVDADLTADRHDTALADYISKRFPGRSDKLVKRNNLANLNRAQRNGINYRLLECCFISNAGDRESFCGDLAGIASGIAGCFGLESSGSATPAPAPSPAPAPDPAPAPKPAAKPGVKDYQAWLNRTYGYSIAVDGKFGPDSKRHAVMALQTEYNRQFGEKLAVDGRPGPATKAAWSRHNIKRGANGNITRNIQGLLIANGYDPNGFDSSFGPGCEAAVIAFQKAQGLADDGVVGKNTLAALTA